MTENELRETLKHKVYIKVAEGIMYRPLYPITDIWARLKGNLIELRMAFTFPICNECYDDVNPFNEDYDYNTVSSVGTTYDFALKTLKIKIKDLAESYWA